MRNRGFFGKTFDLNRDGKFGTVERIMDIAMYDMITNNTEAEEIEGVTEQEQPEEQKTLADMPEHDLRRILEDAGLDMEQLEGVGKVDIIEALEWNDITADDLNAIDKYTIIEALENFDLYSEELEDEYTADATYENEYVVTENDTCKDSAAVVDIDVSEKIRRLGFVPAELVSMGFEGFMKTMKEADILPSDILGSVQSRNATGGDADILAKLRSFGLDPVELSSMSFEKFMQTLKAAGMRPEDIE